MFDIECLPILRITSIKEEERKSKETFGNGYKVGKEEGLREGMNLRIKNGGELTELEYKEFLRYMGEHNLIVSYSVSYEDRFSCGLIVRKDRMNH